MKPFDHSFNETNILNTFLIKPLCFPLIEIRSSVIIGLTGKHVPSHYSWNSNPKVLLHTLYVTTGCLPVCFIFQNVPNQVPLKARLWQGWPLSSAWQDLKHQSFGSKTHCAPNKVFYWPGNGLRRKVTGVSSTIDQSLKTTKKIEQRFFARVLWMASVSCEVKQTNSCAGSWFESNSRSFIGLRSSMEANIFATIPKVK